MTPPSEGFIAEGERGKRAALSTMSALFLEKRLFAIFWRLHNMPNMDREMNREALKRLKHK
jgi:hypothetical protein